MPKVAKIPDGLRPYLFHGVDLSWAEGEAQAAGRCPFCGKEGKFSVEVESSLAKCWSCGEGSSKGGMNATTFLRLLHERSLAETAEADWRDLAADRKLLRWQTPKAWGCAKSAITGDWLVPGWDRHGELANLYQWVERADGGKVRRVLMPTPTFKHQMLGTGLPKRGCKSALLCEGPWDGMAAWEVMQADPVNGRDWRGSFVCAAPTCTAFPEGWAESFVGQTVWIAFDNDHPRRPAAQPAGWSGSVRVARMLKGTLEALPLRWGEPGWSLDLPNGRDVRDHLVDAGSDLASRAKALAELIDACEPVPVHAEDVTERGRPMHPDACSSWDELIRHWRRAFKWTDGLDLALSVMLATMASTELAGESQLWTIIISPPSTGKTTLCEALSLSKHAFPRDTMTSLVSGYQSDAEGSENQSLAPKLNGKTLIIKDADTILKDPSMGKTMSQFRALFDRSLRPQFANKMSAAFEDISCTVILCGTSTLYQLDAAEMGARFLMCSIMDRIDDDLEDDILAKIAHRADDSMTGDVGTNNKDQDLVQATRLTGGYVDWLRDNVRHLARAAAMSDEAKQACIDVAKFVARIRARPSKVQAEVTEREMAGRLVEQFVRLAKCLAVTLNRRTVDAEVLRRVKQVAKATARGSTLELCRVLAEHGQEGTTGAALFVRLGCSNDKGYALLRFLRNPHIGVVEQFQHEREGMSPQSRYRLSDTMARLWAQVMED